MADELVFKIKVIDDGSKVLGAFENKIKKMGGSFKKLEKAVVSFGLSAASDAFNFLGKAATDVVSDSMKLEDAMNGIKRTANLTTDEVASLTEQVRDYSVNVLKGFGTSEQLAEALEIAGQQGVLTGKSFEEGSKDALAFAGTMVKAAVALDGLNLQSASERLGLFHGTFTDTIPTIENAASVLNHFGNTTKRGADFILNLSGRLAESANFVGLSEQATLALAATLGEMNQVASKSGSAMSRVMRVMRNDSESFGESFQLNGKLFSNLVKNDMEQALVVFSKQLGKLGQSQEGVDVILQGMKDLRLTGDGVSTVLLGLGKRSVKLTENLKQSKEQWGLNTSLMNEFIGSSDRVSSLWAAFKEIMSNTFGVIGDMLLPVMREVLKEINAGAAAFREWLTESTFLTEELPATFQALKKELTETVQKLIEGAKNLDWSEALNSLQESWQSFKETISATWEILKSPETIEVLKSIPGYITQVIDGFKKMKEWVDLAVEGWGFIIQGWKNLGQAIKEIFSDSSPLILIWDVMKERALFVFKWIGDQLRKEIEEWKAEFKAVKDFISDLIIFGDENKSPEFVFNTTEALLNLRELNENFGILQGTNTALIAEYKEVEAGMEAAIKSGIEPSQELQNSLAGITDKMRMVQDVGWENSVFPEFQNQLRLTQGDTNQLTQAIGQQIPQLTQLGNTAVKTFADMATAQKKASSGFLSSFDPKTLSPENLQWMIDSPFRAVGGQFHNGGVVKKFHGGGEVPAVLQSGEYVLSRKDVGNIRGGNSTPAINKVKKFHDGGGVQGEGQVVNNFNFPNAKVVDKQALDGFVREITRVQKQQQKLRA